MDSKKEELRSEFYKALEKHLDNAAETDSGTDRVMDFVFDFFANKLHEKERLHVQLATDYKNQEEQNDSFRKKISRLESTLVAADQMFKAFFMCVKELDNSNTEAKKRLAEASQKYTSLKEKSNLK